MVKFAAAGYVCVDYYPDFNNRYYITGNGVDVLFNLLDIKKGKDMEASIISAVSDDEYGKEAVKMFHERNIDCSHPVSYTHLDVYKRQLHSYRLEESGRENLSRCKGNGCPQGGTCPKWCC